MSNRIDLSAHLLPLLLEIHSNPLPPLPIPPTPTGKLLRRSSVAVILRVSSPPEHDARFSRTDATASTNSFPRTIPDYVTQPWVQSGEPEVLLIKRAARAGDKWTSHMALPGGKRDPGDRNDEEVARREAWEEVGLKIELPPQDGVPAGSDHDVAKWNCLLVGALPERLITTLWGQQPLLVLCPYVYIYLPRAPPPLRLQPSEVSSAHWVPLQHLLSPASVTQILCPVSERLSRNDSPWAKCLAFIMGNTLGMMEFTGTKLYGPPGGGWGYYRLEGEYDPGDTEEVTEDEVQREDFAVGAGKGGSVVAGSVSTPTKNKGSGKWWRPTRQGMVLWGITHAVLFEFLDALPPKGSILSRWRHPTFTAFDIRIVIWILGWAVRCRDLHTLRSRIGISATLSGSHISSGATTPIAEDDKEWLLVGGERPISVHGGEHGVRPNLGTQSAEHILMEGYYPTMRMTIWFGLGLRVVALLWALVYVGILLYGPQRGVTTPGCDGEL